MLGIHSQVNVEINPQLAGRLPFNSSHTDSTSSSCGYEKEDARPLRLAGHEFTAPDSGQACSS
jgi:hypothetical protein